MWGNFRYIFVLLIGILLFSCNEAKLSQARRQYLSGNYFAAAETYRKIYAETPREQRAMRGVIAYEMAENYRKLNMSARAATSYANAIRYNYPDTVMFLRYAQMLHKEGQYRQAEKAYLDFLRLDSTNILGLNGLSGVRQAVVWAQHPSRFVAKRADILNSNRSEFSPMLTSDGETLYLTSSRDEATGDALSNITGLKNNDIFVSTKNVKGEWQKPKLLDSPLNSVWDEGITSSTSDGSLLFYTFSPESDKRSASTSVYVSEKSGAEWSLGRPLRIVSNDSLSVFAHPAVSPKGDYLYFVSDMPGGYGDKDIWKAELIGRGVAEVVNLGPEINTPGDEMFPYILNDSTFYFSSNGHPGMGGLDIFEAVRHRGSEHWQIENMKSPINSHNDDFGITFARGKNEGFFSSNRGDARGRDHVWSFVYPDVNVRIEGLVADREQQLLPKAVVRVVGSDGSEREFITNKDGFYRFRAERGTRYTFMARADGFLNANKQIYTSSAEKDTTYFVDFELTPFNKPVILENIFYDFDKATLRPESKKGLDELIAILNEHPAIAIELSSHTDRKGSDEYNNQLSLRRAQAVVQYLISQGIDKYRLTAAGYGKTRPKTVTTSIAKKYDFLHEGDVLNEEFIEKLTLEQQQIADQINRRTEFKVTERVVGLH
ncbi:MAG: OmpA family protein [Dysgonomonadaceae bacterium]|nr:OmpA family protein [Dysgonamonadaceae bacterium]